MEQILEKIKKEIEIQVEYLSRRNIAEKALSNSHFVMIENIDEAFHLLNEYAPEHLIIASDNAEELSKKVINAGSVFIGHYSSESIGDYAAGTNHTLPTNGFARAYSGVSLDSFVKKITFQNVNKEGLKNIGRAVEVMADAEGLDAHKNAVSIRLKNL
jgi:histidinol dehydrogenase